jgi:hypothetical protein
MWTKKWLICLPKSKVSFKVPTQLWTAFWYFGLDYPTSGLTVTGLLRFYCTTKSITIFRCYYDRDCDVHDFAAHFLQFLAYDDDLDHLKLYSLCKNGYGLDVVFLGLNSAFFFFWKLLILELLLGISETIMYSAFAFLLKICLSPRSASAADVCREHWRILTENSFS